MNGKKLTWELLIKTKLIECLWNNMGITANAIWRYASGNEDDSRFPLSWNWRFLASTTCLVSQKRESKKSKAGHIRQDITGQHDETDKNSNTI